MIRAGWSWVSLRRIARQETGHTPSRSHPEYWGGDIPWIGIRDAGDHHGRIMQNTLQTVTEEGLANSSARLLPEGTVCLSRTASVGYVTIMGRPMATSDGDNRLAFWKGKFLR
jgi:type I restriction enzyme, S subunit